jgi:hypothetical protein
MPVRDYNADGEWSVEAVQSRYLAHCARLNVPSPRPLQPRTHRNANGVWAEPILQTVIDGIKAGDAACVALGVELIEQDRKFPFGRILKSNAARALRSAELPDALKQRIRHRVANMLAAGNTPHEFKEYARLLRKVGFDEVWPRMAASPPLANKYAMRHFAYFRAVQEQAPGFFPRGR